MRSFSRLVLALAIDLAMFGWAAAAVVSVEKGEEAPPADAAAPAPAPKVPPTPPAVVEASLPDTEPSVQISVDDEGVRITRGGKRTHSLSLEEFVALPNIKALLDSAGIQVTADGESIRFGEHRRKIRIGKGSVVRIESKAEDRVQVGDNVEVAEGEEVRGDAVAVGGSATIAGEVGGDVVAIGGNVHLLPTAVVNGDVVCIGGRITRDPGSEVGGQVVSVGPGVFPLIAPFVNAPWGGISRAVKLGFKAVQLVVMALIVFLVIALWGARLRAMAQVLPAEPLKLGLIGILGWVLVLPTCILLVISIIGILFLPVFFALLLFAFVAGLVTVYLFVGERLRGPGSAAEGPVRTALVGLLVVHACSLIGSVLGALGPGLGPFPMALSLFGKVLVFLAGTVGLGGVLYTRFGKRNLVPPPVAPAFAGDAYGGLGGGGGALGSEEPGSGGPPKPPPFPGEPGR